jgi:Secretion system C-terminal sorting domain
MTYIFYTIMKTIIYIFILFLLYNNTYAQQYPLDNKRDYVWLTGLGSSNRFTFTENSMMIDTLSHGSRAYSNATICDTSGHLLFYTNGLSVRNKYGQALIDSLSNRSSIANELLGSHSSNGTLILPHPTINNRFFIIHTPLQAPPFSFTNNCLLYLTDSLFETQIDMQTGHIPVVYKNKKIETILPEERGIIDGHLEIYGLYACRHANGRDWWVLTKRADTNNVLMFLLNENGLHLKKKQITGNVKIMGIGQGCFSPNGKHYVYVGEGYCEDSTSINIFDFDRCEGQLNNPQYYKKKLILNNEFLGCAISPNSHYLYVTDQQHILQYDLEANDIFASVDTVVTNNAFLDISGQPTIFFSLALAPNGKIYIMSVTTNEFIGVINEPNLRGAVCNVVQQVAFVPAIHSVNFPNYPNFRLGPVDGSVCDSLDIDNVVVTTSNPAQTAEHIRVFPNPTTGEVRFTTTDNTLIKTYTVVDMSGRLVLQGSTFGKDAVSLSGLENGCYLLILENTKGKRTQHKVVLIR